MLAALGMARVNNPQQYTCERILTTTTNKNTKGNTWKKNDLAKEKGKTSLADAISKLESNGIPVPSHVTERSIFEYRFTTPDHGIFDVELMDYSGELIQPDISEHLTEAKDLRDRLKEMDGLLVLAEAFYRNKSSEIVVEHVHKLGQAFVSLHKERQDTTCLDIPIALVINKWDRWSQMEQRDEKKEREKLKNFLDYSPAHQKLYDTLKNSVSEGNFEIFPVSAFGEHELLPTADGSFGEKPKHTKPIPSFGLEEPFVWLADKRSKTDLHYQKITKRRRRITFCLAILLMLSTAGLYLHHTSQQQLAENQRKLKALEIRLELNPNEQQLEEILRDALQQPDSVPYRQTLINQLKTRLKEISEQRTWTQLRQQYQEYIKAYNFLDAAELLTNQPNSTRELLLLQEQFRSQVMSMLENRVKQLSSDGRWKEAYLQLNRCARISEKLLDAPQALDRLRHLVQKDEDRFFYEQVQRYRDESRVSQYLASAPLKTMERYVNQYQLFLQKYRNQLPLTLVLARINWGNCWNDDDSIATVMLNGDKIIEKTNIVSEKHKSTGEIGRGEFKAKVGDMVKLEMKIVYADWMGTYDHGKGADEVTVSSLNGYTLQLPADGHQNSATFRIEGLPEEPILPQWSEQ